MHILPFFNIFKKKAKYARGNIYMLLGNKVQLSSNQRIKIKLVETTLLLFNSVSAIDSGCLHCVYIVYYNRFTV